MRICLYTLLGIGANILVGSCGFLLLCEGVLFGIGAYACTLCMVELSMDFGSAFLVAIISSVTIAILVIRPILHLRGDIFALASLGIQMILFSVLNNCVALTKGPAGIGSIPDPRVGFWLIDTRLELLLIMVLVTVIAFQVSKRLRELPYGRSLQAVRDDEIAAISLGKNPVYFYLIAIIVSAGVLGASGAFYAVYVRYINPINFDLEESIKILSVIIVGGLGREKGAFLGAVIIILMPEILRMLGFSQAGAAALERVIYGLVLLVIIRFRPAGLIGRLTLR